jgi:hypothetical protein
VLQEKCPVFILSPSNLLENSVVGVATTLWARQAGVRIPVETKMFLLSEKSRPVLELTQPPIQLAPGFLLGDKAARE